jgi:hypothetical protein
MYRHRGHRYITTRQFGRAIEDLERRRSWWRRGRTRSNRMAQPNRFNIPVSTLHTNIWYHLALAHYLRHDFEGALPAWRRAVAASTNDDMLVASSDWLYMTLRRLGRTRRRPVVLDRIRRTCEILENDAYHRRLLMYKGVIPPDSLMPSNTEDAVQLATYGYGLANWYLYNGESYTQSVAVPPHSRGPNWAAFGYIAAEAEIAGGAR